MTDKQTNESDGQKQTVDKVVAFVFDWQIINVNLVDFFIYFCSLSNITNWFVLSFVIYIRNV